MTKDILKIRNMKVTSFVGRDKNKSVQITLEKEYVRLTESEVIHLCYILLGRLDDINKLKEIIN